MAWRVEVCILDVVVVVFGGGHGVVIVLEVVIGVFIGDVDELVLISDAVLVDVWC